MKLEYREISLHICHTKGEGRFKKGGMDWKWVARNLKLTYIAKHDISRSSWKAHLRGVLVKDKETRFKWGFVINYIGLITEMGDATNTHLNADENREQSSRNVILISIRECRLISTCKLLMWWIIYSRVSVVRWRGILARILIYDAATTT